MTLLHSSEKDFTQIRISTKKKQDQQTTCETDPQNSKNFNHISSNRPRSLKEKKKKKRQTSLRSLSENKT